MMIGLLFLLQNLKVSRTLRKQQIMTRFVTSVPVKKSQLKEKEMDLKYVKGMKAISLPPQTPLKRTIRMNNTSFMSWAKTASCSTMK